MLLVLQVCWVGGVWIQRLLGVGLVRVLGLGLGLGVRGLRLGMVGAVWMVLVIFIVVSDQLHSALGLWEGGKRCHQWNHAQKNNCYLLLPGSRDTVT